jgi:hypothetical protein
VVASAVHGVCAGATRDSQGIKAGGLRDRRPPEASNGGDREAHLRAALDQA